MSEYPKTAENHDNVLLIEREVESKEEANLRMSVHLDHYLGDSDQPPCSVLVSEAGKTHNQRHYSPRLKLSVNSEGAEMMFYVHSAHLYREERDMGGYRLSAGYYPLSRTVKFSHEELAEMLRHVGYEVTPPVARAVELALG